MPATGETCRGLFDKPTPHVDADYLTKMGEQGLLLEGDHTDVKRWSVTGNGGGVEAVEPLGVVKGPDGREYTVFETIQ